MSSVYRARASDIYSQILQANLDSGMATRQVHLTRRGCQFAPLTHDLFDSNLTIAISIVSRKTGIIILGCVIGVLSCVLVLLLVWLYRIRQRGQISLNKNSLNPLQVAHFKQSTQSASRPEDQAKQWKLRSSGRLGACQERNCGKWCRQFLLLLKLVYGWFKLVICPECSFFETI
jgi:hypothetical protein